MIAGGWKRSPRNSALRSLRLMRNSNCGSSKGERRGETLRVFNEKGRGKRSGQAAEWEAGAGCGVTIRVATEASRAPDAGNSANVMSVTSGTLAGRGGEVGVVRPVVTDVIEFDLEALAGLDRSPDGLKARACVRIGWSVYHSEFHAVSFSFG
jgi:hypothetical protein